ncbi:Aconitate hydratase [Lutibaculum baratangense AMV1]|uniref:Aconitate hydratase A n=1 Tax=Lutibaculum baratangense AMV1 TaxID=631454 RepID=V4TBG5_9HYPH|nr:Aconitate hydratase [Lutibaculum baratangense AMV1]
MDVRGFAGSALPRLPHTLRILLENALAAAGDEQADESARLLLERARGGRPAGEIAFRPGRILMHDTTSVPALVDVAALRDAVAERGGDPASLNPVLPIHAMIDHSVAVDRFASSDAISFNMKREMARNAERYRFLKWADRTFENLTVFPPGTGILHTVNIEWLSKVAVRDPRDARLVRPDTLVGTDSHTPMINALGMLAWGVGGLEAEMAMFGLPLTLALPKVVGVRLTGRLRPGVMATDLALVVTERLRRHGVVGAFVEFFGEGLGHLPVGARAAVANMAPEYGATTGFFPIDRHTLRYLRTTGRDEGHVALVEAFARLQGLWAEPDSVPDYDETVEIDLDGLATTIAGPTRPQDAQAPAAVAAWAETRPDTDGALPPAAVAIAAITSCTNSADPRMLVAAGLLARNARRLGLKPPPWVKTSFAPGSTVATRYLERAGLLSDLAAVGFDVVGIGCTTCIGNSGPLVPEVEAAVRERGAEVVAVLSGNRNFSRRVHPLIENGFLCSPPMVVAFALAGSLRGDIGHRPLGRSGDGREVRLEDIWPGEAEIDAAVTAGLDSGDIGRSYGEAMDSPDWAALDAPSSTRFPWDPASTYLRRPPFVERGRVRQPGSLVAAPLIVLGDDITTDHISPAGAIPPEGSAGRHLQGQGQDARDLNVFAARRGNFEVMLRGAFTNRNAENLLCPEARPGETVTLLDPVPVPAFEAAARMCEAGHRLVMVAGERYGSGSSRDWAAKGPALLGVEAVLASSFERIHRSNLIGMGILPLRLPAGVHVSALGLEPSSRIEIDADPAAIEPGAAVPVLIETDGRETRFTAHALVDTAQECELLRHGGVLPFMLNRTTHAKPARKAV